MHKKILFYLSFALILVIFGYFYCDTILHLPLFGDATIHGLITKKILQDGLFNTGTTYPPLYNLVQAVLYKAFGEIGMNLMTILGLLLLSVATLLYIQELLGSYALSLIGVILVLASPKIIFYSSRMYMEIFLSALFVLSTYQLVKYLKNRTSRSIIFLGIFVGLAAATKQQGLMILFPSTSLFLVIIYALDYLKSKNLSVFKHLLLYLASFSIITIPAYLYLYKNAGQLIPGNSDFGVLQAIDEVGQKIVNYQPKEDKLNNELQSVHDQITKTYYSRGAINAESKHIWPLDPITSWQGFKKINSLYVENFGSGATSTETTNIFSIFLLIGFTLFSITSFSRKKLIRGQFLLFIVIFLINNYALFSRNTDQMRYHLFITLILSPFLIFPIDFLQKLKSLKVSSNMIPALFLLLLLATIPIVIKGLASNKGLANAQIYAPSRGGIPSIIEVGSWIHEHTNSTDTVWQTCNNETAYYAESHFVGDFTQNFMNEEQLMSYFDNYRTKYIVLLDSQIVDSNNWTNFCKVSRSYAELIDSIYKPVFITTQEDISVYEIQHK